LSTSTQVPLLSRKHRQSSMAVEALSMS